MWAETHMYKFGAAHCPNRSSRARSVGGHSMQAPYAGEAVLRGRRQVSPA